MSVFPLRAARVSVCALPKQFSVQVSCPFSLCELHAFLYVPYLSSFLCKFHVRFRLRAARVSGSALNLVFSLRELHAHFRLCVARAQVLRQVESPVPWRVRVVPHGQQRPGRRSVHGSVACAPAVLFSSVWLICLFVYCFTASCNSDNKVFAHSFLLFQQDTTPLAWLSSKSKLAPPPHSQHTLIIQR